MAFTLENLTIATNHIKSGIVPSVWYYYNEDNDLVTTANFFSCPRLTVGDIIYVTRDGNTNASPYRVSAKSTDGFTGTVVKIATEFIGANPVETSTAVTAFHDALSLYNDLSLLVTTAAAITDVYTAGITTDLITLATKTVTDNMLCTVTTTDTVPGGLATTTDYYTRDTNAAGTACKLSATLGGVAIDITAGAVGVQTLSGSVNNFTLADGAEGQRKYVKLKTDGTLDAVLIPDNLQDGTTITFGTANESVKLQFEDGSWQIIANDGGVVA